MTTPMSEDEMRWLIAEIRRRADNRIGETCPTKDGMTTVSDFGMSRILAAALEQVMADRNELLRLARNVFADHDTDESEAMHDLDQHVKGCGWLHTPEPVIAQVVAERDRLRAALERLLARFETLTAVEQKPRLADYPKSGVEYYGVRAADDPCAIAARIALKLAQPGAAS